MHPRFLAGFGLASVAVLAVAAVFSLWLRALGELSIDHVIVRQRDSGDRILFVSGIHQDFYSYKKALASGARAAVAVIGSSRAMQVRGEYFRVRAANWGGAVDSVASLETVLSDVARPGGAALAVVFLDLWWFNGAFPGATGAHRPAPFPRWPAPAVLHEGARIVLDNWRRPGLLLRPVEDRLGLLGILSNEGFDARGSYHYVSTVTGAKPFDAKFADIAWRLADAAAPGRPQRIDSGLVRRAATAVRALERTGVSTVLVLPPFAGRVLARLRADGMGDYPGRLAEALRAQGVQLHDLTDAAVLLPAGAMGDCEFIDGSHGGDVLYARILERLAQSEPAVAAAVDAGVLRATVERFAGRAQASKRFLRGAREVDFLGIGCDKK
jgi:hypothetical protein